jgi:hypothetical protein
MSVMSTAKHGGAVTSHLAVVGELTVQWATQGGVVREEAGVVHSPHEFLLVCELGIG